MLATEKSTNILRINWGMGSDYRSLSVFFVKFQYLARIPSQKHQKRIMRIPKQTIWVKKINFVSIAEQCGFFAILFSLRYTREMYAIIAFSEILVLPERRFLDLNAIPKMIRSCLYSRLNGFSGLRTLILGKSTKTTSQINVWLVLRLKARQKTWFEVTVMCSDIVVEETRGQSYKTFRRSIRSLALLS
jgi:hypothetical protein